VGDDLKKKMNRESEERGRGGRGGSERDIGGSGIGRRWLHLVKYTSEKVKEIFGRESEKFTSNFTLRKSKTVLNSYAPLDLLKHPSKRVHSILSKLQ